MHGQKSLHSPLIGIDLFKQLVEKFLSVLVASVINGEFGAYIWRSQINE